jgi:hypothetical protein
MMKFFNDRINTSINAWHKIQSPQEGQEDYSKHWWICTGICCAYQPFNGVIRSSIIPNESLKFWSHHHEKCAGSFFKVFEIEKRDHDGSMRKKYIRSIKYMNPKPKNVFQEPEMKKQRLKPKFQVREHVDITNDDGSPLVQNLCEIVDLDESQFNPYENIPEAEEENSSSQSGDLTYWNKFYNSVSNWKSILSTCVNCRVAVGENCMISHLDFCTGYQQKVELYPRKLAKTQSN